MKKSRDNNQSAEKFNYRENQKQNFNNNAFELFVTGLSEETTMEDVTSYFKEKGIGINRFKLLKSKYFFI
jgi:hypothetical protein